MLRILLWKLGFEWANLMRILRPRDDQRIYYFAFGANLSPTIMQQRCIEVFEAFDYELEDAELRFTQSGFYKGHGFASADPAPGKKVYGRMYLIRRSDEKRMDYYEGVPFIGSHEKLVQTDDNGLSWKSKPSGLEHEASSSALLFYYYRATTFSDNLKPTQEYLDYITFAYREMEGVPDDYVAEMEKTPVLETFEMQTLTGKFVRDLESWPVFMQPLLVKYEGLCRRLVMIIWNWSLLTWMIRDKQ